MLKIVGIFILATHDVSRGGWVFEETSKRHDDVSCGNLSMDSTPAKFRNNVYVFSSSLNSEFLLR